MTIYVNFDVETTGTVPGLHSMISFGAIAHRDPDFMCLGHFEINISEAWGAGWDVNTRVWWKSPEQAQAYAFTIAQPRETQKMAMRKICLWLKQLLDSEGDCAAEGPIVFVAYPASFDMSFLNYYMQRYLPEMWRELTFNKSVGWSCMDVLTLAAAILDVPYLKAGKKNWPEEWVMKNPMPHVALEDARTQSVAFVQMMRTMRGIHRNYKSAMAMGMGCSFDVEELIQLGTDYTGDEMPDEPDELVGVDLGPATTRDLK